MKKLIAKRQIRYMGKAYNRGDPLPSYDLQMVKAWLSAESAAWEEIPQTCFGTLIQRLSSERALTDALRSIGVELEDEFGNFIGLERLLEQIHALAAERESEPEPEPQKEALSEAGLASWKKADLEKLAADLGADISSAKTNAQRAATLAAAAADEAPEHDV